MILYVSIGNSDDKLSQREWSQFVDAAEATMFVVANHAGRVHGRWFSLPYAAWQNACWCVEIDEDDPRSFIEDGDDGPSTSEWLKQRLAGLAAEFNQDSIAVATAATEFIAPDDRYRRLPL